MAKCIQDPRMHLRMQFNMNILAFEDESCPSEQDLCHTPHDEALMEWDAGMWVFSERGSLAPDPGVPPQAPPPDPNVCHR